MLSTLYGTVRPSAVRHTDPPVTAASSAAVAAMEATAATAPALSSKC